jgi:hypothetical protein
LKIFDRFSKILKAESFVIPLHGLNSTRIEARRCRWIVGAARRDFAGQILTTLCRQQQIRIEGTTTQFGDHVTRFLRISGMSIIRRRNICSYCIGSIRYGLHRRGVDFIEIESLHQTQLLNDRGSTDMLLDPEDHFIS